MRTSTVLMRSNSVFCLSFVTYSMCCTIRSVEDPTRPTVRKMYLRQSEVKELG